MIIISVYLGCKLLTAKSIIYIVLNKATFLSVVFNTLSTVFKKNLALAATLTAKTDDKNFYALVVRKNRQAKILMSIKDVTERWKKG